ncbi:MAG: hypothetical protein ACOYVF_13360 [Candidatus Zixiibacteriota bacterium]
MHRMQFLEKILLVLIIFTGLSLTARAADDIIIGKKVPAEKTVTANPVRGFDISPYPNERLNISSMKKGDKVWALPSRALAADFDSTINVLVLRVQFQEEVEDDPNTTGNGIMNVTHPKENVNDSLAYFDSVGHWVDPPPHDSLYFDAHMRSLNRYWETVSDSGLQLTWNIFPSGANSVYQLPHEMSYYGKCSYDSVVLGLQNFFIDCIELADEDPDIAFADYQAIIIFHAGADRQNDLGYPLTCCDLFTGYIRFIDTALVVDDGAAEVNSAVMMPEYSSQDNRAVAINAVMAHEFGHQLGLIDLYNTYSAALMSCLGDFALMDNNGFNTGLEMPEWFSKPWIGTVFGAMPIYPCAWSRAYLGFDEVVDYRQGSDIRLVAAEAAREGVKIARIPISEMEYYLIEVRTDDMDGIEEVGVKWDADGTGIFLWPKNEYVDFNREYDALIPGAGMLIYHVDESVAWMNFDASEYDTLNNFDDNDLQWDRERRFVKLVEADGIENFHGYYSGGYGEEDDMFREDNNGSFTPNTNPPAIDNSGNNTHIYIENISRLDTLFPGESVISTLDTIMTFDLETRGLVQNFPVRVGPYGYSVIADDLNYDGKTEIITACGNLLAVFTADGHNFLMEQHGFDSGHVYYDDAAAIINPGESFEPDSTDIVIHLNPQPVPLYVRTSEIMSCAPVTGQFDTTMLLDKYVAIGFPTSISMGVVLFYTTDDNNLDGRSDAVNAIGAPLPTRGYPIALSFGSKLYALTDSGYVYFKEALTAPALAYPYFKNEEYFGICRISENRLLLMAGDTLGDDNEQTRIYYMGGTAETVDSLVLDGYYKYGPVLVDVDKDYQPEIVACTPDGDIVYVTVDTTSVMPSFSILAHRKTGYRLTTNPAVGDVDLNGYPDIIIGGQNAVYAFNQDLTLKTGFPIEVNDRYPDDIVAAAPITTDLRSGGVPEIIFPTEVGNINSFGPDKTYGFPLSAGEYGLGSCVYFVDSSSGDSIVGRLGYIGADGWFYAWSVDPDTAHNYWPMIGRDPEGSFRFINDQLQPATPTAGLLPEERFYNYPNPVLDGATTITYWLNDTPENIALTIYDLSGREVKSFRMDELGRRVQEENEVVWNCGNVTPGVYRCLIKVDFSGSTETSFTDIAVIR